MPADDIDRPAADLTRRISALATSTLANALDNLHWGVHVGDFCPGFVAPGSLYFQ